MTSKPFSLNKRFKELLQCVEGTSIKRKELIELAIKTTEFNRTQSIGLVTRNVRKLMRENLITASGERNSRAYNFTDSLLVLLEKDTTKSGGVFQHKDTEVKPPEPELQKEEAKTSAELRMILGEIEAYRDLLTQYPTNKHVIQDLLKQAKEQSTQLYGRLNAINKVLQAIRGER